MQSVWSTRRCTQLGLFTFQEVTPLAVTFSQTANRSAISMRHSGAVSQYWQAGNAVRYR